MKKVTSTSLRPVPSYLLCVCCVAVLKIIAVPYKEEIRKCYIFNFILFLIFDYIGQVSKIKTA